MNGYAVATKRVNFEIENGSEVWEIMMQVMSDGMTFIFAETEYESPFGVQRDIHDGLDFDTAPTVADILVRIDEERENLWDQEQERSQAPD
jgi:hypothetical protein